MGAARSPVGEGLFYDVARKEEGLITEAYATETRVVTAINEMYERQTGVSLRRARKASEAASIKVLQDVL